jgi:ribose transport system ATP-binding protein
MTDSPRFEMRGIRKAFRATVALAGVDLSVSAGEICGLIGQNGAGKSTLMNILAGALTPDAGEMRIDGERYAPRNPIEARRAGVAMIHQELSLAPHLSVAENILVGAEPTRFGLIDRGRMRETAARALAELGHDDIPPDAMVGRLSVAAQQLVEIARADCAERASRPRSPPSWRRSRRASPPTRCRRRRFGRRGARRTCPPPLSLPR